MPVTVVPHAPTVSTPSSKKGGVLLGIVKRRGRKPKVRIESRRDFLGYVLRKGLEGYAVYAQEEIIEGDAQSVEEQATHISVPSSLQERFVDADLRQEVMGFATRIRTALHHKDNCKIHLDKVAPQNVSISYTIHDAEMRMWYLDPTAVDVSVSAFDSPEDHAHFLNAVAHQNFSNKAYKKWREGYKEKALDEMVSGEIVRMYGNGEEKEALERMQSKRASMQRKEQPTAHSSVVAPAVKSVVRVAAVAPMVAAPIMKEVAHISMTANVAPSEMSSAVLDARLREVVHASATETQTPSFVPPLVIPPSVPEPTPSSRSTASTRPFQELESSTAPASPAHSGIKKERVPPVSHKGYSVVDEEEEGIAITAPTLLYRAPKKEESMDGPHLTGDYWHDVIENYHYTSRLMERYRGVRGFFAREFRHNDFQKDRAAHAEATRQYHTIRPRFVFKDLREDLAEAIDAANIHLTIEQFRLKTAFWLANAVGDYGQYSAGTLFSGAWSERCDVWFGADDDSNMGDDVRNATLVGLVRMGILGVPFASTGDIPTTDECLALIYEGKREYQGEVSDMRLNTLIRQRTWNDPHVASIDDTQIALLDAPTVGYIMGALAFRALLNGAVLSLSPDDEGYSALALRLSDHTAEETASAPLPVEEYIASSPAPSMSSHVSTKEEARDELIKEVFSQSEASPKKHAVRQETVKEEKRAASEMGMPPLEKKVSSQSFSSEAMTDDMARAPFAESLSALRRIYGIHKSNARDAKEAKKVWERWSTREALLNAGIVVIELGEGETLVGAARRVVRAYDDFFEDTSDTMVRTIIERALISRACTPATITRAMEEGRDGDMLYADGSGNAWWVREE